jgi:hypothetical protein
VGCVWHCSSSDRLAPPCGITAAWNIAFFDAWLDWVDGVVLCRHSCTHTGIVWAVQACCISMVCCIVLSF